MPAPSPASLVDLARYPIGDPAALAPVVGHHGAELRATGVSILPGFLRAEVLPDADAWPEGHPRLTWDRSSVHTVAYDRFDPATSGLRALFEWDELRELVSAVLGRAPRHRYADPLGAMNLAVMHEGDRLGWHFDQTDFVVSLAIQSSEGGGHFENVQRLRWTDAADGDGTGGHIDERYDEVAAVLAGEATKRVTTVPMEPGTLMLFEGRWSLHRVSPVTGPTPRHVALFGYDTEPGTMSSELLKLVRYGRAA